MPSIVFPDDLDPWITSLFEICKQLGQQADELSELTPPDVIETIHDHEQRAGELLKRAFEMGCFGRLHEEDLESLGRVMAQGDARSFGCNLCCHIFPVNDRAFMDQFPTVAASQAAEYRCLAGEVYGYGNRLYFWSEDRAKLLKAEHDVEPILHRNDLREPITKSQVETLRTHLATDLLGCETTTAQHEFAKAYHPSRPWTSLDDGRSDQLSRERRAVWDRIYNRKVKTALLGAAEVLGLGNISKVLLENFLLRKSHEWDRFFAAAVSDEAEFQTKTASEPLTPLPALPKPKTSIGSDPGDCLTVSVPDVPKVYLSGWREILDALGKDNNKIERRRVRDAHEKFPGPIIMPTQGGQPKVVKADLLVWWNELEDRYREDATARDSLLVDRSATVENQFDLGRDEHQETVVDGIAGHIKRRRGSA